MKKVFFSLVFLIFLFFSNYNIFDIFYTASENFRKIRNFINPIEYSSFNLENKLFNKKNINPTVFIGDSHVKSYSDVYKNSNCIFLGFPGITSIQLYSTLINSKLVKISTFVVLVGSNDVGIGIHPDTTKKKILKIFNYLKKYSKNIYIIEIPYASRFKRNNKSIFILNNHIKNFSLSESQYLEINKFISQNSELIPTLSIDGLHLNDQAIKIIFNDSKISELQCSY